MPTEKTEKQNKQHLLSRRYGLNLWAARAKPILPVNYNISFIDRSVIGLISNMGYLQFVHINVLLLSKEYERIRRLKDWRTSL